jgi:hypothetical protein
VTYRVLSLSKGRERTRAAPSVVEAKKTAPLALFQDFTDALGSSQ